MESPQSGSEALYWSELTKQCHHAICSLAWYQEVPPKINTLSLHRGYLLVQEEDPRGSDAAANKAAMVPQSNMAELPPESQPLPTMAAVPSMGYSNAHLHLLSASS